MIIRLGQAFVTREDAEKKQFEDKLHLITIEKDTMSVKLEEKMKELDWHINALYKSDETIATLTDANQKLQKSSRDLALRCSKAAPKDVPDLQMHAMCLLTQKAYHETDSARSRSPRRRKR